MALSKFAAWPLPLSVSTSAPLLVVHCPGQNPNRSSSHESEIERLRKRVRELEDQIHVPASENGGREILPRRQWEGFHIDEIYYGPSSLEYFNHRLYAIIHPFLPPVHLDFINMGQPVVPARDKGPPRINLSKQEEDRYLDLYWFWFHPLYPILIESSFRSYYSVLWSSSTTPSKVGRKPSPLVDIMLALCLQFTASFTDSPEDSDGLANPAQAGCQHYRNCQATLATKESTQGAMDIQCYILSAVYLSNGGFHNQAQTMVAKAARAATILGYEREVVRTENLRQQELARRIWWTVYQLDSQIGIDTGRPFLVGSNVSRCSKPSDSPEVAEALGSTYDLSRAGVTCLAFQNQSMSLIEVVRGICKVFFSFCDDTLSQMDEDEAGNQPSDLYSDAPARERCAKLLMDLMKRTGDWVAQVPADLRLQRQSGAAFSRNRSPYIFDQQAPVWLQYQRILLELEYHHYCAVLYRSFMCFFPNPAFGTPFSDSCTSAALTHAVASTLLIHQAMSETDLLSGCYRAFYFQKNSTRVILGFTCGYPVCPMTPCAKRMGRLALRTYEELWPHMSPAVKEEIRGTKELIDISEKVLARFKNTLKAGGAALPSPAAVTEANTPVSTTITSTERTTEVSTPAGNQAMTPSVTGPESLWLNLEEAGIDENWGWPLAGTDFLEGTVLEDIL